MSMTKPWVLYVTTDLPDQGSAYALALARLGQAVQDQGIEVLAGQTAILSIQAGKRRGSFRNR